MSVPTWVVWSAGLTIAGIIAASVTDGRIGAALIAVGVVTALRNARAENLRNR